MNDIEKIKRQISKPVTITLKNDSGDEDKFELKPLNMAQQAMAFDLSKKFKNTENPEENLDRETIEQATELILGIVKRSFEGIDDDTAEDFVASNFLELMDNLEHLMPQSKDQEAQKKIEERRKRLESAKRKS